MKGDVNVMQENHIWLSRERLHITAVVCLALAFIGLIVSFFDALKLENGIQVFISVYTSFNTTSLVVYWWFGFAIIFFALYKYNMLRRKNFLEKGVEYPGIILDTIYIKRRRTRKFRLKIQYDGDKVFLTPRYDVNNYTIISDKCSVYVLNGKCYASDFKAEDHSKAVIDGSFALSDFDEEKYLLTEIEKEGFNRAEFLKERVTAARKKSDKYILPMPIPAVFSDGKSTYILVDIYIQSNLKRETFALFHKELAVYILEEAKKYSSSETEIFYRAVKTKLYELLRTYYHWAKILDIKIGSI